MHIVEFNTRYSAIWGETGSNIRSLDWVDTGAGPVLVATGGPGGGLMSLSLGPEGLQRHDSVTFDDATSLRMVGSGGGSVVTAGGDPVLILSGLGLSGRLGYRIDDSGSFGPAETLPLAGIGGAPGGVMAGSAAGWLYGMADSGRLQCFRPDGAGFSAGPSIRDTADSYLADPVALTTLQAGGTEFLLSLSATETGLSAFRIGAAGGLELADSKGVLSGLGLLSDPTDMATVQLGGKSYVLVTSAADRGESGAISVLELTQAGELEVTDHLLDSLNTRFGRAQAVEVLQDGDWTYVVTGGGDAGLSLFLLLPGGRLLHLDSFEDVTGSGLDGITDLALMRQGAALRIVAASETAGLAELSVDLSARGMVAQPDSGRIDGGNRADLLLGGTGDNSLFGQDGDDTLADGRGADRLTGGGGRDVFVLEADGLRDVITDFQLSEDWLDLSSVPMLYGPQGVEVIRRDWGAILRFSGGEETELHSHNGRGFRPDRVLERILWSADRPNLGLFNEETGGPGRDTLIGGENVDILKGGAGADLLRGGDNGDSLYGGDGDDRLEGEAGGDLLDGGAGNDWMHGGAGEDILMGGWGNDRLLGGFGQDRLEGGDGNDGLDGGGGADRLQGGTGRDSLLGGAGADLLLGGAGNDRLEGQAGADTLHGGSGADWAHGGADHDLLTGGEGNDRLLGGYGHDRLLGQAGDDTLRGGHGNDTLRGGIWSDRLEGDFGHDLLEGGAG
ncbi:calcium-binding protein, partial [Pseudooceanicola sp. C21-150M6]|uniref:calcium-binding protein n=1 Tax=Pseudooceanicola sp. C21-150M6 TaxID=3434355 RepID=UPI003D7FD750